MGYSKDTSYRKELVSLTDHDFYTQERFAEQSGEFERLSSYTAKTFLWMFLGLLVTFGVAFAGYATMALVYLLYYYPSAVIVLTVAELAVVLILSARLHALPVAAARILFLVYAALNGVVFSSYFLMFDMPTLILVFAATAVYFGALAAYGYFTKTDLCRLRPILISGLIFLLVFGLISLFLPFAGGLDRAVCLIGIVIFLGFTAYDTQKIKAYHAAFAGDPAMAKKASIFSALQLYLDFINLFLYLLRFLNRRRN